MHPNTVRYRLKRAADTTGWDATDPREAYVLRTAISLGRRGLEGDGPNPLPSEGGVGCREIVLGSPL